MLTTEQVFTFAELARRLPKVGGKKIHVSTLHRWCRKGVRGVLLEFRMLGGRIFTSVEAVDRFSKQLAEARKWPIRGQRQRSSERTPTQRERDIARANRVLDRAGI